MRRLDTERAFESQGRIARRRIDSFLLGAWSIWLVSW